MTIISTLDPSSIDNFTKIQISAQELDALSDLTAYRNALSGEFLDEQEWHNLYQYDLRELAQRWQTLDAEDQGLLAWAINRIL